MKVSSVAISATFFVVVLLLPGAGAFGQQMRAGQVRVAITNPIDLERPDEVVGLSWSAIREHLPALTSDGVRAVDAGTGEEVPSQAVDNDGDGAIDELLIEAGFFPRQERAFLIEARAPEPDRTPRAFVMHMAERDDVAWENERVAFRTYGEGLWELEDLVSSGIDVWLKRTRDLVVERWYADGHYHTDTGEGADFFAVGQALGAGGTAIWRNGEMYRAPNFKSHRIVADGPLRAVIELQYGPFDAGGIQVEETKRITIDAGTHVFRSESTFRTEGDASVRYVTGLVEREGLVASIGPTSDLNRWSWLSGWGPVSRASGGHGDLGTAVIVPTENIVEHVRGSGHHLIVAETPVGEPAAHYVAAGWTASGDFDGPASWWAHLDDVATRLSHPLRISY